MDGQRGVGGKGVDGGSGGSLDMVGCKKYVWMDGEALVKLKWSNR